VQKYEFPPTKILKSAS